MKTLVKHLTALVLIVAWSSSLTAAIPVLNDAGSSAGQNELVRAKMIAGVWMPVVDLPEVEIVANRFQGAILKGHLYVNEVIAEVNLPEVVIQAKSAHLTNSGPNVISDSNLPIIEITAAFPQTILTHAENSENGLIAVVQLPEVIIDGDLEIQSSLLFPMFAGLIQESTTSDGLSVNHETHGQFTPKMHETIFMTLKRCIRQDGEKLICEVSMMITSKADVAGISEKIFRLLLNYH